MKTGDTVKVVPKTLSSGTSNFNATTYKGATGIIRRANSAVTGVWVVELANGTVKDFFEFDLIRIIIQWTMKVGDAVKVIDSVRSCFGRLAVIIEQYMYVNGGGPVYSNTGAPSWKIKFNSGLTEVLWEDQLELVSTTPAPVVTTLQFKVGDRVEYVGKNTPSRFGKHGTITAVDTIGTITYWECKWDDGAIESTSGLRANALKLLAPIFVVNGTNGITASGTIVMDESEEYAPEIDVNNKPCAICHIICGGACYDKWK